MLQSELDGKRVVVALGGNALGDAPGEQLKLLEGASKNLARMVKEGINVVVTHGNGPQVGIIDEAFEVASKDKDAQVPPMPLSDCNAMRQGYIGAQLSCALRNEFHRQDIMREVANVPTHVVVDADDPAFKDYEKPIGAFMTEIRGPRLREGHGIPGARGLRPRLAARGAEPRAPGYRGAGNRPRPHGRRLRGDRGRGRRHSRYGARRGAYRRGRHCGQGPSRARSSPGACGPTSSSS